MPIYRPSSMAFTAIYIASFISPNLDGNHIGNKGCELLSQTKWNHLSRLNLSQNEILSEGMK